MPAFGRLVHIDERDWQHPMLAQINLGAELPSYRFHPCREAFDQGNLGACTGTSARGFLEAHPVMTQIGVGPTWRQIYDRAQQLDPFPGQEPEMSGSTVRAAMKALQEWGFIESYVWADSVATAKTFLLQKGPIVVGCPWMSGMMSPDSNNVIHATGNVVGGHAFLIFGWSDRKGCFRIHNSWGRGWGQAGNCWISEADLTKLFGQGGEICAAIQKAA